jgi:uncharacterized protein
MAHEIRIYHASELRALTDNEFALSGYAARFDQPSKDIPSGKNGGSFTEVIRKGAFTRVLASNPDVRCLFNHDENRVLGRTAAGTLALKQDDKGLAFRCQLDRNNSDHRNLHSAVQRGDISECSFGFSLDDGDDEWSQNHGKTIRTIRSISHLYDCSVVTHPAYDGTSVAARKTAPAPASIALNEDALLRARAAKYANDIRMQDVMDKSCRAVKMVLTADGIRAFRDYERERELKALDESRSGFAFEAASEDGGQVSDPQQSLRCKAWSVSSSESDHRLAAQVHRVARDHAKTSDDYARHDTAARDHDDASDYSSNASAQTRAAAAVRCVQNCSNKKGFPRS